MSPLLIPLSALLLTGCASLDLAADRAADVSDRALEVNEWGLCQLPTMGAWLRRYGADPERAAAWAALCLPPLNSPLEVRR
jgi:hypothetical protein